MSGQPRERAASREVKKPGGRKKRSPYAALPYDARLLVRFLEILCPDQVRYVSGGKYTSRVQKAVLAVLAPGSEDRIKFSGFEGVWLIRSDSRPSLNRWYICDLGSLSCEVDVSQLNIPEWMRIDERDFFCEDHRHNGGLCWHIFACALAEAARVDNREFPVGAFREERKGHSK